MKNFPLKRECSEIKSQIEDPVSTEDSAARVAEKGTTNELIAALMSREQ